MVFACARLSPRCWGNKLGKAWALPSNLYITGGKEHVIRYCQYRVISPVIEICSRCLEKWNQRRFLPVDGPELRVDK